jgi:hypothetical protein
MSMQPLGEGFGAELSMSKKIGVVAVISMAMGIIVTVAEPDLTVLAEQVSAIPNMVLILTISIGVGFFLVIAVLRVMFGISLSMLLILFYVVMFAISAFTPADFLSMAFDSGGVTTGPITVPFIMSLGVGLASLRSDQNASSDSFGLVALCSVGPIIAVMVLGIFYRPDAAMIGEVVIPAVETTRDVVKEFLGEMPHQAWNVLLAVSPIVAVFIIFQAVTKRFKKIQILRMSVGFLYAYIGLVLFFTGVEVGFVSVGHMFGAELSSGGFKWLLIPIGALCGYFIVTAEPAVHILNNQVQDVTNGLVSSKTMNLCLSIGVAVSVGLAMLRVITGISIYWIVIPGYIIALGLTFFVPKLFVGIAFDSGGVASGPMSTTFLLPFAMGASEALGGNIARDAFGIVALVAMTPLIAIQVQGLSYRLKLDKTKAAAAASARIIEELMTEEEENEIIDFNENIDIIDEEETENELPEDDLLIGDSLKEDSPKEEQ